MNARPSTDHETSASRIEVVVDLSAFEALRPAWNALLARCPAGSVFLTHEWFDAAWQWRRRSASLRVHCMWRGPDLVAVLPLILSQPERRLELLTVPDTQFCDAIVPIAERAEAAVLFAEALRARRGEWDVLRLGYLPDGSFAATFLQDALRARHCAISLSRTADNPYVALGTTWEEFYSARPRSLKKANNLNANRLSKAGEVAIEWLEPGLGDTAVLRRVVDVVSAISQRSWKAETGNSLDNPGPQAVIRRLSELAHERGWLSVWILTLAGKPFAMEYQLVADGCVYALRSDFDAEGERLNLSPGSHLSRYLLEKLFGRGLERYFMGPGNNAYKYRWTDQAAPTHEMTAYADSLRGRSLASWDLTLKPAMRRLRDRIRARQPTPAPQEEGD
jgi:CelD/BcsL family acetyltransferase involved in cellulose biosynthesis